MTETKGTVEVAFFSFWSVTLTIIKSKYINEKYQLVSVIDKKLNRNVN